jgi:hypothetical protein
MPGTEFPSHGAQDAVSFEHAVTALGVSPDYLAQLLDARTIGFELVSGGRHIPVGELEAYRQRRAGAQMALRMMGGPGARR